MSTARKLFYRADASVVRSSKFEATVASILKARVILIIANGFAIALGGEARCGRQALRIAGEAAVGPALRI
jgi:hypothetical protein